MILKVVVSKIEISQLLWHKRRSFVKKVKLFTEG